MTNLKSQISIFDTIYPKFIIDKPIRLIELFAGYGSQALALKYLGVPFEYYKICEWAVKSIQAYKDIHFTDDTNYSKELNKEQIQEFLFNKGISSNYNEPMTREQINRLNEDNLRTIYNNIKATHNLVNIQQVKGSDLEIKDTDKYCYILTYSFPCQDLSLAGTQKGMSDTSTRSGMLWEVERILDECKELGTLPQVLLMENVPQVHGSNSVNDFNKWQLKLESLGYKNYWEDLIATDYGIPQTRNRCFMVSILGDYAYSFPPKQELKLKLKDLLEDNVDEKYFLSDKQIKSLENGNYNASKPSEKLKTTDKGLCQTLDTMAGGQRQPLIRVGNKRLMETLKEIKIDDTCYINTYNKAIDKNNSGTITTGVNYRNHSFLAIKNDMKKDLCNNLIRQNKVKDYDVIRHSYTTSRNENWNKRNVEKNNLSPTLDTRCDCLGVVINPLKCTSGKSWQFEQQVYDENGSARTLKASEGSGNIPKVVNNLRIRKLTPKECFRLMGVKDEDFEKCSKNQSNASLYHLAGDSIVVNVLMEIFKQMIKE